MSRIMSASSVSSATMNQQKQRQNETFSEFNIWDLIKRKNTENAFCMTSKFRMNSHVRRIKSAIVTRQRRLTESNHDDEDRDSSSSSSSGFNQDWETFDDEDDDLYELYDMLAEKANINEAASSLITLTKQFSQDRPSSGMETYMIEEVANKGSRAQKLYMKKCVEFQVSPSKLFLKSLNSQVIDIGHQNIGPKGAEACAIALTQTSTVKVLNMNDNNIGHKGAKFIAYLLKENRTITELNLADNNIGLKGARFLTMVIAEHDRIRYLDLSSNGFKDKDALVFKQMLEETRNLIYLNLSHNAFREVGGELLGEGIGYNDGLEELDMSWNHLRRSGAVAIAEGLLDNSSLKRLNLSWNGFHLEGCIELQRSLWFNQTLEVLNLTNNRINRECIDQLTRGLAKNSTLHTLILKFNPMTQDGAHDIVQFINDCPTSGIKTLDLGIQQVDSAFVNHVNEIHLKERAFTVIHGLVIGQKPLKSPDLEKTLIQEHASLVLIEFGKMMGFRLMDLFCSLDKSGSRTLDRNEIAAGLKMANVPFSDSCIDSLIKKLDIDGDGEIDFSELLVAQQEYRMCVMELLEAERGDGEVKVEDTTLWRIRTLLQKLLAENMTDYASFRLIADKLARHIQIANDEIESKREAVTRARATKPRAIRSIPTSPITFKPNFRRKSPTPENLEIVLTDSELSDGMLHESVTRLDLVKIKKILNDEQDQPEPVRRKMSIHLPIRDHDRMVDTKNFKRNRYESETSNATSMIDDSVELPDSDANVLPLHIDPEPLATHTRECEEDAAQSDGGKTEDLKAAKRTPRLKGIRKRKSKMDRPNLKVNTLLEETPEMTMTGETTTPTSTSKSSKRNLKTKSKI